MTPIIVLLLLADFSCKTETRRFLPTSAGTCFVFSYQGGDCVTLSISSASSGTTAYTLLVVTELQGRHKTLTGNVTYPSVSFEFLPTSDTAKSGKSLPVYVLTSQAEIFAVVNEMYENTGMDVTWLIPSHVSGTEYYLITWRDKGVVIVTSYNHSKTNVEITLKNNVRYLLKLATKNRFYPSQTLLTCPQTLLIRYNAGTEPEDTLVTDGSAWIDLHRFQSYFIQAANRSSDLTGMHVRSDKPVAVIQGASWSETKLGNKDDICVDSAVPVETLGRFFVVPYISTNPKKFIVKILTAYDQNEVLVQAGTEVHTLQLESTSDWFDFVVPFQQTVFVSGHHALYLVQIIMATESSYTSGRCLMSVPPLGQWTNSYTWADVGVRGTSNTTLLRHFAVIVVESQYSGDVILDGHTLPAKKWDEATANVGNKKEQRSYKVITCDLWTQTEHEIYVKNLPNVAFLVWLYSSFGTKGYCTSPSQVFKKINVPFEKCVRRFVTPGDMLDNDCDGEFDEEANDRLDNDGDGLVDEDLEPVRRVNGDWGQWTHSLCYAPCGAHYGVFARTRKCNNPPTSGTGSPCPGLDILYTNTTTCTTAYVKCPSECTREEWGHNCSEKCANCEQDCDKETGECEKCSSGFTSRFCSERCPQGCSACDVFGTCRNLCPPRDLTCLLRASGGEDNVNYISFIPLFFPVVLVLSVYMGTSQAKCGIKRLLRGNKTSELSESSAEEIQRKNDANEEDMNGDSDDDIKSDISMRATVNYAIRHFRRGVDEQT